MRRCIAPLAASSPSPSPGRNQKLKLYTIVKEYEALKEHVPSGVYLMPAFDDAYTWHGVVFVYRGSYANGVFRFVLSIPAECVPQPGTLVPRPA